MSAPEQPPAESSTSEPVDLTSTNPHSLHQAVYARRAEYVRPHRVRVKVGTWNVAASPGTDKDLANWFVDGKGLDATLATLDLSHNPAIETDDPDAGNNGNEEDIIRLVGGNKIGLYVLGLQEVIDLNTATSVVSRVYASDGGAMDKWKAALESALPDGYELVTSEQLSGLLLLVYASPEVAPTVSNVSTVSVGTGLFGYLGNKGAVVTRIILGESTRMLFVNCHLASGHEASFIERRIWDIEQILSRAQFQPVSISGVSEDAPEKIGDEDFAFWFGDLNFRLDGLPGDDIRRLLMLHTRGEYDLAKKGLPREDSLEGEGVVVNKLSDSSDEATDTDSAAANSTQQTTDDDDDDDFKSLPDPDDFLPNPHDDPASLQATLDSLLPHDQLKRMINEGKIFKDGWREGPITFLPSYKYDVGTVGVFDSSDKRRAPSWCDRILYRTRRDKEEYERKIKEAEEARKRDEEMKAQGMDHAGDDDEVLFDYDPDHDADEQPRGVAVFDYDEYDEGENGEGGQVLTKEGFMDRIHLDIYTSHQRVSSSDHKPIISIFTLNYDAVVPELKAKIHSEVARELDRAENEGRPGITIVVDSHDPRDSRRPEDSDHVIDFGNIRFLKAEASTVTLANTGRVPATFSFVEKPTTDAEDGYGSSLPEWLKTSFIRSEASEDEPELVELSKEVTLEPGETVNALLEVLVDDVSHARMLNDGQMGLEEVLVLRVTDGRDHFLPVRATWSPTCIGRSIEELIRVPKGGIRRFSRSLSEKNGRSGSIPYDLEVVSAAPRELFKLTEAVETLTERVLADAQMLEECKIPEDAGWPFDHNTRNTDKSSQISHIVAVIDALDIDQPIGGAFNPDVPSTERLEAVSEVLLLFLRGLADGIISITLWNRIEQVSLPSIAPGAAAIRLPTEEAYEEDKGTILDVLSTAPNHNISFVFLTATLGKVASDLSPLTKDDLEVLKMDSTLRGIGALARRSLSFRRSGAATTIEALAALERRQARERMYSNVFGNIICRAPTPEKAKDRKIVEDKERALVELFLRRRGD
ncbi:putative PI phosphatase group protein [Podospora appendiculata]|uniref:PI phosphatase group protein n=1 Tax=Podospora appendiculata TaxID=314037 RepID=A0AAE0X500_9PEZI|nr:putative PI phosphatase group protein [Podospora appendiculata]